MFKNKTAIGVIIVLAVIAISAGLYWNSYLEKAHSTFENYAAFRGCTSTSNKTATSSDCVLKSGGSIKLVEIHNKWYLEGDGPGIW